MKKILLLNFLALSFPLAVHAKGLTAASTLRVHSPDGLTVLKDLSVTLSVSCRYHSGIFFPEAKSCGSKEINLPISADGLINIPATEKFGGIHARKTDHYEINLAVHDGKQYLAVVAARGQKAIESFSRNKRALNILRLKPASIAVSHAGQDFFGSELAHNKDAYMLFSIRPKVAFDPSEKLLVVSSLDNFLWSRENKNLYAGKVALKDTRSIEVPATSFAYLGEVQDMVFNVGLSYSINTGVHTNMFKAAIEIPAKNNALEEIGTLELK